MLQNFFTRFVIIVILVDLLFYSNTEYVKAEQECTGKICFSWAFGAIVGDKKNRKLIEIRRDTELKSGDQLKMLIKLKRECFIYVFYYSAQGKLYMIFPYSLNQFSTDYILSKKYYIPQGNFVFELDDTAGHEKFYLIASVRRLSELENLYGSYESAETSKKPGFLKNVIDEIKQLRKQKRKLTIDAERPSTTLGPIRSPIVNKKAEIKGLDKITAEYNAKDFFAKTYTIDHK